MLLKSGRISFFMADQCSTGLSRRFPDKESVCKAGDTGLIPGLGREDPLEKEMATLSSILA